MYSHNFLKLCITNSTLYYVLILTNNSDSDSSSDHYNNLYSISVEYGVESS